MIKKKADSASSYIGSLDFSKGVTIVRLRGNITIDTLKSTRDEFTSKTRSKIIKNMLFDLREVSRTDTSGIAALIDLLRYMKTHQAGGKIGLINIPEKIKSLFSISKTQALFNEYSSEEEAIEELK